MNRNDRRGGRPSPISDEEAARKMAAETAKRRDKALPVSNFLIDGESGLVLMSAAKTKGGVALIDETTVSMTLTEFAQASGAFMEMIVASYLGVASMMAAAAQNGGSNGSVS